MSCPGARSCAAPAMAQALLWLGCMLRMSLADRRDWAWFSVLTKVMPTVRSPINRGELDLEFVDLVPHGVTSIALGNTAQLTQARAGVRRMSPRLISRTLFALGSSIVCVRAIFSHRLQFYQSPIGARVRLGYRVTLLSSYLKMPA